MEFRFLFIKTNQVLLYICKALLFGYTKRQDTKAYTLPSEIIFDQIAITPHSTQLLTKVIFYFPAQVRIGCSNSVVFNQWQPPGR